jgi:hypothetical protein
MPKILSALLAILLSSSALATDIEVFGKGSVSKTYYSSDNWNLSVSLAGGLAIQLFSQLRLEARYTNISSLQNQFAVGNPTVGNINDMKTETEIYSLGVDIDILNEKASVKPFIYLGAGYLVTQRSMYFTPTAGTPTYIEDQADSGFSANLGLGFRIRLSRSAMFEIEAFAYSTDVEKPTRLINWIGTVGLRFVL